MYVVHALHEYMYIYVGTCMQVYKVVMGVCSHAQHNDPETCFVCRLYVSYMASACR